MSTYILFHNPAPKIPNAAGQLEYPAREIVCNIRKGLRATTAFGGWNIETDECEIKEGDNLLFYRSKVDPRGFFAVGRVLPVHVDECRDMRKAKMREWYGDDANLEAALKSGFAIYASRNWKQGEGEKTLHINAEWDIVVDPEKGGLLSSRNIKEVNLLENQKGKSGARVCQDEGKIRAECLPEGKRSHFNEEWDVVDCPQRGQIFIRRGI